jgi:hypothetical protein
MHKRTFVLRANANGVFDQLPLRCSTLRLPAISGLRRFRKYLNRLTAFSEVCFGSGKRIILRVTITYSSSYLFLPCHLEHVNFSELICTKHKHRNQYCLMFSRFSSCLVATETRREISRDRPVSRASRQDNLIFLGGLEIETGWNSRKYNNHQNTKKNATRQDIVCGLGGDSYGGGLGEKYSQKVQYRKKV